MSGLTQKLYGKAAILPINNIDTDTIIPQVELITTSKVGLGKGLFAHWRYLKGTRDLNPNFPLNLEKNSGARILITGENFGCGSSREHAVWALKDYGIDIIIAPSFGDIFYANCFKNLVLPIVLDRAAVDKLMSIDPLEIEIDLEACQVNINNTKMSFLFQIENQNKMLLLSGEDEISLTNKHQSSIELFEKNSMRKSSWAYDRRKLNLLVLPGDGIGKEVVEASIPFLELLINKNLIEANLIYSNIGESSILNGMTALSNETLALAEKADAIFLGAVGRTKNTYPKELRPEDGLLSLRKKLDFFINMRPAKNEPFLRKEKRNLFDIMIIRELSQGVYYGEPREIKIENGNRIAINTWSYSEDRIKEIAHEAFQFSMKRKKCLHSVDKANVLESSQLWRDIFIEVGQAYPEVKLEHLYVDNAAMQLILQPEVFDVIVTENMFGDILSDLTAGLVGSIGVMPSASFNQKGQGLYEPIHGCAPHLIGKNRANPIGAILSIGMLLEYSFKNKKLSDLLQKAVDETIRNNKISFDLTTSNNEIFLGTTELAAEILKQYELELNKLASKE